MRGFADRHYHAASSLLPIRLPIWDTIGIVSGPGFINLELKTIKRVQVMSFALTIGVIYALVGFIVGILFAVLGGSLFVCLLGMGGREILEGFGALSALAIIIFPIMYFIMGFIGSAIAAILYNIVAPRVGGIQVELE